MRVLQDIIMFALGGFLYVLVEIFYRGYSHPSMFLVGGLCVLLIGKLDVAALGLPLLAQAFLGAALITGMELLSGLVVNVGLGWAVWDYSTRPLNFMGQICLQYSLIWIPMSLAAVFCDDFLRKILFGTPLPVYRWIL